MSEIAPGRAQEMYHVGIREFGNVLLWEDQAKGDIILNAVLGGNVLLVGEPGGGKSTLARASHLIIDGINDWDLAKIPPEADLTPREVVGGRIEMDKKIAGPEGDTNETTSTEIPSLIKPWSKVIFGDEVNRVNPAVLNALLSAYEERIIYNNTSQEVALHGLEYAISTMNPAENRAGVFPLTAALASRMGMGIILGNETPEVAREIRRHQRNGWKSHPQDVRPVMNLDDLHAMRKGAHGVSFPENLDDLADDYITRLNGALRDGEDGKPQIKESHQRMNGQMIDIAKASAYLGGKERIDEQDLNRAIRLIATARLGALSPDAYRQLDGLLEYVFAR